MAAPPFRAAPAALIVKKPVIVTMKAAIAAHAGMALAAIVALTVIIVWMYVYYHGALGLGPYARPGRAPSREREKERLKKSRFDDPPDSAPPRAETGRPVKGDKKDAEIERLIDTISRS